MVRSAQKTVNVHEAKTHLSRLIERVEDGEEIVIARAGRPAARLVPLEPARGPRKLGVWRGQVTLHEDFDDPPEDVAVAFRGERP